MIKFFVPVKTLSLNRVRGLTRGAALGHAARKKKERETAKLCTIASMLSSLGAARALNGWIVAGDAVRLTFTRLYWNHPLDKVNLHGALKHVEDGVADALKIDDGSPFWKAEFAQRKVKRGTDGVEVEIR